ncbi:aminoglycoside 6-adenylyltransferase [Enterococcus sp. DIV0840]|uniref:aminoglycoside 6-adenylyltransferase n=1 Tax=Enterococcus TaxID=1350 RepID=UPI001A8F52C6|nr:MULTISPECIES: aminoglycoside 6-adenylyltransferase [Enterococcus]MBO0433714.1 aminoglycoside 6-adenylyltransferase [Enterococcus sp. DIV0849a]MBO0475065.1 aminoglycoside 6-adenylyltransferase [Enterococcus ureasiticus]
MRTEEEMFRLILDTAKNDPTVLAVGMNGSRTNKQVPKDSFQDYDIVYIVESVDAFVKDQSWINRFGPRLIMQTPEDMVLFPPTRNGRFTYLMLFEDGNRIDLTLCPKEQANTWNEGDRLAEILLDKEQLLPKLTEATDQDYWVKRPSQSEFLDCCNEFWWVSTYVVKGLCRNELFYAADHLNENCRKELLRLLSWQVGADHDYHFSVGKNYKYLPDYLTNEQYEAVLKTMDVSSISLAWSALIALQKQFDDYAWNFSQKNGLVYDRKTAEKVMKYTMDFNDGH